MNDSTTTGSRPPTAGAALRTGQRFLGILYLFALGVVCVNSGDWVHLLWSVQFALAGLFLGAGLLLVQVWPDQRRQHPAPFWGRNGASVALLAAVVLGSLPILFALLPLNIHPVGRVDGSPFPALLEVVRYGFDETVPTLMEPEHPRQLARGLGHPPRFVTVPMGTTLFACGYWILFVGVALIGRALPAGRARRVFLLKAPVVLGLFCLLLLPGGSVPEALWSNEPWLVRCYGPVLVLAAVATLVLYAAIRLDERRALRAGLEE